MSEDLHRLAWPIAPVNTAALVDRYSIGQLAQTYALGVDMRDLALARSAFSADAYSEGSNTSGPIDEYLPGILKAVSAFKATQHNITNQYIRLDGDEAMLWSYAFAIHKMMPDAERPDFDLGVTYRDQCRRYSQGWLIVRRKVVIQWSQTYPRVNV
jgi:hypothetical protein